MKNYFTKYAIILGLLLLPVPAFPDDLGIVRLSLIQGDVQILIKDTTDWASAAINLPLNEHDRIWVPDDGRTEIQIRGGVYVRAGSKTALDLLTLDSESAQVYLDQGQLYINNRRGGIQTVQIDTPVASVRTYDNSIVMIDVSEDGINEISVLKGVVHAESRSGSTRVSAGNTLSLFGEYDARLSPINAPNEWEQWNVDRDREVSAWNESSRYLPEELHEYSSDFDQNGHWDYVSDYGYVWFPVVTTAGWSPYSFGNWIWIRGNYVWVDYDPWGWAPSHYGRWVFLSSRGWCWVPPAAGAVYWGPGYVGWVVTSSYVAWVPLAPGEIYFGYGYYGPGSVNIATINVNTVTVNRHYRNARERNSVVVVQRDSFGTGRREPVRIQENPFTDAPKKQRDIHIVPPRVRPNQPIVVAPPEAGRQTRQILQEREQRTIAGPQRRILPGTSAASGAERSERSLRSGPASRTIQPQAPQHQPEKTRRQPPERVIRNRPEALKNERPLVKQPEASVFQPRQPRDLPVQRSEQPRSVKKPSVPDEVKQEQQQQRQPGRENGRRGFDERKPGR